MDHSVLGRSLRGSPRWTAADFLLHGRYCEPETIADAVERLRGATESRLALLVAYRGDTLFHSLLLLADANRRRGNRWQTTLLTGARWRGQSRSPLERFAEGEINDKQLLVELRRQPPFERIAATLRGHLRVMSRSSPPGKVSDAVPPTAAIHVILIDPKRDDKYEVDQSLAELLVMVNGSAAVVVHGNLEAERTVDAALDRISGKAAAVLHRTNTLDPSVATLSAFAEALLHSALILTNSRLGNVYLAKRDGEHLELLAHERNTDPRKLINVKDPTSVVSWVYRRRRPMVINNIPDFLRVHPDSGIIDVAGSQGKPQRELAVPIIQHSLAGGAGTIIGVVNVEKLRGDDDDDDDGGYSYRDVTVLRSVAHRIALWRASSMVQQTSATLAGLMKMSTSAAEWHADEQPDMVSDARIPSDAIAAHEIIEETLRSVYRLTRSYTATMCLLSPNRRWITRFASYPKGHIGDPHSSIRIEQRTSVVAWAARNGKPCYLWNVLDRRARRWYPELEGYLDVGRRTRSELSLPIFVGGRVVGVLDLESRIRDGYVDSVGIAAAVAEQLGLAIQHARRFHEQAVISMSTATTANVHELGKLVDLLRDIAGQPGATHSTRLCEIANGIVDCSQSGAAIPERPPVTTFELVLQVLSDLELTSAFTVRGAPFRDRTHVGADALALRSALAALLENAYAYADDDDPGCAVSWRHATIGGKDYVTILITNNIRLEPDQYQLHDLFRRPLRPEHSIRTRLGAFTAGALVRSLGGDVFVERSYPPRFMVGVDLPLDSESATREEAA